jgi:putative SOS response-associated peptidase YedK
MARSPRCRFADRRRFPDYPAPVIRNAGTERELTMMRWGMPPPPRAGGYPVTNSAILLHRTGEAG